jgi:hypothetical protein
MPRTLPAVVIAVLALIGAPAVATLVTVSSLPPATAEAATDVQAEIAASPAVWAWGATGLLGLGAMVTFGATVVRRSGRATDRPELALVESPAEIVATPSYA